MVRRFIVMVGAVLAVIASLMASAAAGVKPVPGKVAAGASTLPFNTQAQMVAGNIVNEDESASALAAGVDVKATAAKPIAQNYDASFVGISIISPGLQITVAGQASAALLTAIADQSNGMPVSVKIVNHSMTQLAAVQKEIGADVNFWAAQGTKLTAWGPDLSSDKVSVMLADYSPTKAQAIIARYGNDWVSVDPVSAVASASSSRTSDSAPWFGGDEAIHRYNSQSVSVCTTGFSLTIAGRSYVSSAAHCLESNYSNNFYNPGGTIGTIYGWNNDSDTVIINASSAAGFIWSDPNSASRSVVKVAPTDPVNGLICTDGLSDREVCSVQIKSINQSVRYTINGTSTTVVGLVYACQTAGHNAFSIGDSGAPVEVSLGSTQATAYGSLVAHGNSYVCGWYLPERYIESEWGASVVLD